MRSNKQNKERYRPQYSKDAEGLQKLICWLLNKKKADRIKVLDKTTADRLGITVDRLRALQTEVTQQGIVICNPATTRTWYSFAATAEQAA